MVLFRVPELSAGAVQAGASGGEPGLDLQG